MKAKKQEKEKGGEGAQLQIEQSFWTKVDGEDV